MRIALLCAVVCSIAWGSEPGAASFTITTAAGGTYCGDGRLATAAYLGAAEGLAADNQGNLYVSDATDHRVRKIDSSGFISTIAGNGYAGFRGDGGPAISAELHSPYGIAVDASGNVYIADLGNARVRKVTPDGIITTVAGGSPRSWDQLVEPRNVAVDHEGNLYVSDFGAHRVYRVTSDGSLERIAGVAAAGSLPDGDELRANLAPLRSPAGLVFDSDGVLYVADSGNGRIRRIEAGMMTTVSTGIPLLIPAGIALDTRGRLYIADKALAAVIRVSSKQTDRIAGNGIPGYAGDGGAAPLAQLTAPRDIALDTDGNLYIADVTPRDPHPVGMVRRVAADGTIDTAVAGLEFRPLGDTGIPAEAHLNRPSAVAADRYGALYIADRGNHRVRKAAGGIITTLAGPPEFEEPAGLAASVAGKLHVSDAAGNRVWLATASGALTRVAGILGPESSGYSGDGDAAVSAALDSPQGLAFDRAGSLYIADTANHAIREVTPEGFIITIAGTGVEGDSGDGGAAYAAHLRSPSGLALDAAGNLYIADTGNHRVRRIDALGRIDTVAGDGIAGFSGDGGPAFEAQLRAPEGVAVDAVGNLYISDTGNHRIRRVEPDGSIRTVAGTGAAGWAGDGQPALTAELNEPAGLAFDEAGNLFVADRGNDRVRKLAPSDLPPPTLQWDVVNAASRLSGPVAPGEIVSIMGSDLGPSDPMEGRVLDSGLLATELAGAEVSFDGTPGALLSAGYGRINVQVPYEIAGQDSVEIEVRRDGLARMRFLAAVRETAPGLFTMDGGAGQAAANNEDGKANSAANPASPGSVVTLFATGEGQTRPRSVSGKPDPSAFRLPALPCSLKIGDRSATILSAAGVPGAIGMLQVRARVPEGLDEGAQAVELKIGSVASQPGVTIAVR